MHLQTPGERQLPPFSHGGLHTAERNSVNHQGVYIAQVNYDGNNYLGPVVYVSLDFDFIAVQRLHNCVHTTRAQF